MKAGKTKKKRKGTSAEQDTRFSNKMAFASELEQPIDMSKVNMEVIRPWIATRVTELLGFEDEVLINFIYGLLDVKIGDGKHIELQLTGFMEKNTGRFIKELWGLLASAQNNANGIPQVFLEKKAAETQMKKESRATCLIHCRSRTSVSQNGRRVSAPKRLSASNAQVEPHNSKCRYSRRLIPTPAYRLISEYENVELSKDLEHSSALMKSRNLHGTGGCAQNLYPIVTLSAEDISACHQRLKELFAGLMNTLNFSSKALLQEKWEVMNSHSGLRLNFSEVSVLLFPRHIQAMCRSLLLAKRAVELASREILFKHGRGYKREMLMAGDKVRKKQKKNPGNEDRHISYFENTKSRSSDFIEECSMLPSTAPPRNILKLRKSSSTWKVTVEADWSPVNEEARSSLDWISESVRIKHGKDTSKRKQTTHRGRRKRKSRNRSDEDAVDRHWKRHKSVGKTAYKSLVQQKQTRATPVLDNGCTCNVLVIEFDRGWREFGATVERKSGHGGWFLSVLNQGENLFTQEVMQSRIKFTTNKFTGAYMWKGDKSWILEFKNGSRFNVFRKLHEECFQTNRKAVALRQVPVPKFRVVKDIVTRWRGPAFIRPAHRYITAVDMDLDSRVLYDMDSEDEEWLGKLNGKAGMYKQKISEHKFEKVVYNLEKYSYARNELLSSDAASELCLHVASLKIIKLIHGYWIKKRQRKGMPLVRHFQPARWEQYQQLQERRRANSRGAGELSSELESHVFAFCMPPRGLKVPEKQRPQMKTASDAQTDSSSMVTGNECLEAPPLKESPEITGLETSDRSSAPEVCDGAVTTTAVVDENQEFCSSGVRADDDNGPEQGQLVLKKFTGRASAQEQKRLKIINQLQRSGIKHYARKVVVPPTMTKCTGNDGIASGNEALLSLRERARELYALADAAMSKDASASIGAKCIESMESMEETDKSEALTASPLQEDREDQGKHSGESSEALEGSPQEEDREDPMTGSPQREDGREAGVTESQHGGNRGEAMTRFPLGADRGEPSEALTGSPEREDRVESLLGSSEVVKRRDRVKGGGLGIMLRPRNKRQSVKQRVKDKKNKNKVHQIKDKNKNKGISRGSNKEKTRMSDLEEFATWSVEIRTAMEKLKEHRKNKLQMQSKKNQMQQRGADIVAQACVPLSIKRIPKAGGMLSARYGEHVYSGEVRLSSGDSRRF